MLTERQMSILTSLSELEILTRTQIQVLHDTKGLRNTNYIMRSLKDYTNTVRLNENAYYLNKKGAALFEGNKQVKLNDQLTHKLMRNDAYIYFNPEGWASEREFKKPVAITSDAYFVVKGRYYFLEVDNVQKWHVNVGKLEKYQALQQSGIFRKELGYFPTLIWVVKHVSRKERLAKVAREKKLICDIYLHEEIT